MLLIWYDNLILFFMLGKFAQVYILIGFWLILFIYIFKMCILKMCILNAYILKIYIFKFRNIWI